ncbi:MAG: 4-(cytidine 5'-diphospho)-2-C-methyl-D-erythritol kinase [Gammaproteobacteria bacterium]
MIKRNDMSLWMEKWPAPAKLNLMLRITGRRDDGYHLLQTVFQIVDWCDWLTFHPVEDGRVLLRQPMFEVPEEQNLTVRAARLLQQKTGCRQGVCIEVEKALPMGGGLGGGSSDAATTLVVLNLLWGLGLSVEQLMSLGVLLGADVPVFVSGHSAWGEGVGEVLEKINLPQQWFVIIKPDCHVSTKEIFCSEDLTRDSKPITINDFMSGRQNNDCLAVVRSLYKPIDQVLKVLSEYGCAKLTGTGACVFVQFDDYFVAKSAVDALMEKWEVYLAKGVNVSPLRQKLNNI